MLMLIMLKVGVHGGVDVDDVGGSVHGDFDVDDFDGRHSW